MENDSIEEKKLPSFMSNNEEQRFIRVSHCMLMHENFITLTDKSKIMLLYIYDWVDTVSELEDGAEFELPADILAINSGMTEEEVVDAIAELEDKGFLKKAN